MKIGIDLDGTFFPTYEKMQEQYKKRRGKEFNSELLLNSAITRNLFDRVWIFIYFLSPENYRNIEPYPNAVDTICKLKEFYEIYFLTARPPLKIIKEVTERSIKEYFDIPVVFCRNFEDKLKKAKNLGIQLLIEDNIASIMEEIIMYFLILRRPWNKNLLLVVNNFKVKIVESWEEINELLNTKGGFLRKWTI